MRSSTSPSAFSLTLWPSMRARKDNGSFGNGKLGEKRNRRKERKSKWLNRQWRCCQFGSTSPRCQSQFMSFEKHHSGIVIITCQELWKSKCNNTDYSNTEYNNTYSFLLSNGMQFSAFRATKSLWGNHFFVPFLHEWYSYIPECKIGFYMRRNRCCLSLPLFKQRKNERKIISYLITQYLLY